jgi:esterase/lipase superfamily enzyme
MELKKLRDRLYSLFSYAAYGFAIFTLGWWLFGYFSGATRPAFYSDSMESMKKEILKIMPALDLLYKPDLVYKPSPGHPVVQPPPVAAQSISAPCQLAPGHNCQVKVFFATDRKPSGFPIFTNYFGGERNEADDPLTFGTVLVSIPAEHRVGHLEEPLPFFSADPRHDLVVVDLKLSSEAGFISSLSETIGQSRDKEALIFIHGYHVTFDEAARRTAQLAWDLQFQGVPILYSWPSRGDILYTADEASALWAVPHLESFLRLVAQKSGANTIHVVAHSLGNRALMYALQQLSKDHSSTTKVKQIVLAAPDIDAGIFRQLASAFPSTADHVTIYASSHDKALALSKFLHQYPSMGKQPIAPRSLGEVVDLIDASVMSDDLFSFDHSYYAGNVAVLEDMAYVIRAGLPPSKRLLLDPHPSSGVPVYWTFRP